MPSAAHRIDKTTYPLIDLREGNTVTLIEHNLDVVACADWAVELGPEGGDGEIIVEGTR